MTQELRHDFQTWISKFFQKPQNCPNYTKTNKNQYINAKMIQKCYNYVEKLKILRTAV